MAGHVFLSYASEDEEVVEQIEQAFDAQGIRCWIDKKSLRAGSTFESEIASAIRKADVFVLIVSRRSMDKAYVRWEIQTAYTNRRCIVPVLIEPVHAVETSKSKLEKLTSVDTVKNETAVAQDAEIRNADSSSKIPSPESLESPVGDALLVSTRRVLLDHHQFPYYKYRRYKANKLLGEEVKLQCKLVRKARFRKRAINILILAASCIAVISIWIWLATPPTRLPDLGSSDNPMWAEYVQANPSLLTDGLTIDHAVRLAIGNSPYYQAQLRKLEFDDQSNGLNSRFFQQYRRGFYSLIAIGELNSTRPSDSKPIPIQLESIRQIQIKGYVGLLRLQMRIVQLKKKLMLLDDGLDITHEFYNLDRVSILDVREIEREIAQTRREILLTEETLLSEFVKYSSLLGVPVDVDIQLKSPATNEFEILQSKFRIAIDLAGNAILQLQPEQRDNPDVILSLVPETEKTQSDIANEKETKNTELQISQEDIMATYALLDKCFEIVAKIVDLQRRDLKTVKRLISQRTVSVDDRDGSSRIEPQNIINLLVETSARVAKQRQHLRETPPNADGKLVTFYDLQDSLHGSNHEIEQLSFLQLFLNCQSVVIDDPISLTLLDAFDIAKQNRQDLADTRIQRQVKANIQILLRDLNRIRQEIGLVRRRANVEILRAQALIGQLHDPLNRSGQIDENATSIAFIAKARLVDIETNIFDLWIDYLATRIRFCREIGTIELDDDGLGVNDTFRRGQRYIVPTADAL